MRKLTKFYIYHCYFCRLDFGLSALILPTCPCCKNDDDVLLMTQTDVEYGLALGSAR